MSQGDDTNILVWCFGVLISITAKCLGLCQYLHMDLKSYDRLEGHHHLLKN